jgi:glycosyltransferase involved in cell wall biosynthesis
VTAAGGIPADRPAIRALRVAFIGHKGIPALHGGIERHVDEIARRLARRGHRVDVFNRPYHPYRDPSYDGVRILRRPSVPSKHLDAGTHTALCVLEAIASRRYDVLHIHGIGPGLFAGLARPFLPTVFTFHAQDWRQRKWGRFASWSLRRSEAVAVRRAHAVITVSRLLAAYVRTTYAVAAHYIPNGATPSLVPPGHDLLARWDLTAGGYVLFVGRLIPDRGLETLLDAWARIDTRRLLVIAGDVRHDRPYVDGLRRRADARVVFTGQLTGDALAQLYGNAAFCVHPSEVEGLPIAVLEAMSHGRAVLVSDIPENLEAVGDAAATFPVGDQDALQAGLQRLLAAPGEVGRLGERARQRVRQHYDWDQIAAATEAVYLEALARASGRRGNRLREPPPG